jgi:predicted RNA polymerase sigma factor
LLDIRSARLRSGELELRRGSLKAAREHFQAALALARNPMERRFLEQRVNACDANGAAAAGQ